MDSELSRNVLIVGRIGTGKTTTNLRILYEWALRKKPALIFDFKNDYLSLLPVLRKIPDLNLADYLWIFLVGEDKFAFNPLHIPIENGKLMIDPLVHIETFTDIFVHCFGLREPSASILVTCLKNLFEDSGVLDGKVVQFPTLSELKQRVWDYEPLSNYDRESKRSIYTRLRLLTGGVLGKVFQARVGVKLQDILNRFVILGLGSVPLVENKRFLIEIFLGMIYEYAKRIDDRTKTTNLIVIEEAHNVLPKEKSSLVNDILTKPEITLMELRDFGIGQVIIDQQPDLLSAPAIAVTGTKIIHALDREEDKKAIANAIGLTKDQMKHLSYLKKGEVFLKLDRETFPYPFHGQIEPITFTGQVKRDEIEEHMKSFFDSYPLYDTESITDQPIELKTTSLELTPVVAEERPLINAEKILENSRWLNSVRMKMGDLSKESHRILFLLGEGLACKSSDFKSRMKLTGHDFKHLAVELAKKGLIGFKKPKARGNPVLYFLRPEGLTGYYILKGKWPYQVRVNNISKRHTHSQIKEGIIEVFRKTGWELVENRIEHGYVDVCLKKEGLTIPVEVSTGSNKYDQVYNNVLKCVQSFGGVYFVCENEIAYNVVLQQASKVSFDNNDANFLLYVILYEDFLEGKKFEKYEF